MTEAEMLDGIARKMRKHGLDDFPYSTRLKAAQAALAAIRETHAIVPRVPTKQMTSRGYMAGEPLPTDTVTSPYARIYAAMIAAAEGEG